MEVPILEEWQRIQMLQCPEHPVDVVLDTDAFNEVDDQFALAYLLANPDRLRLQAVYAAPFLNEKADAPKSGMEKSRQELLKLLDLAGAPEYKERVLRGAEHFMADENTPAVSEASEDLIRRALSHSKENPLYVVGIAAATDIASALLCEPEIRERTVVIWLGGSAFHCGEMEEFNLAEDVPAAQVLFHSRVPLVQLPCWGVVENFAVSRPELETYFLGKNRLADYLAGLAIEETEKWASGTAWAKVIWDVTAVAWLLNDGQRFMKDRLVSCPEIAGASGYVFSEESHTMKYVYRIERDALLTDLIRKICGNL